jgi:hypothetical protein
MVHQAAANQGTGADQTAPSPVRCHECGGDMEPGNIAYAETSPIGPVYFENVPALTCGQCGNELVSSSVAKEIEHIVRTRPRPTRSAHTPVYDLRDGRYMPPPVAVEESYGSDRRVHVRVQAVLEEFDRLAQLTVEQTTPGDARTVAFRSGAAVWDMVSKMWETDPQWAQALMRELNEERAARRSAETQRDVEDFAEHVVDRIKQRAREIAADDGIVLED